MENTKGIAIPGSHREPLPGARYVSPVSDKEKVSVTLVLRRRGGQSLIAPASAALGIRQSRNEFASVYGADPRDMEAIEAFAHEYGLAVVHRHDPSRRIVLTGPVEAIQRAFDVQLGVYDVPETGIRYRGRTGSISVPSEIRAAVVAVLGLDDRPVAKAHVRRKRKRLPRLVLLRSSSRNSTTFRRISMELGKRSASSNWAVDTERTISPPTSLI